MSDRFGKVGIIMADGILLILYSEGEMKIVLLFFHQCLLSTFTFTPALLLDGGSRKGKVHVLSHLITCVVD